MQAVETVHCPSCGRANTAAASFCIGCGAPARRRCTKCGAAMGSEDRFCAACGQAVSAGGTPPAGTPSPLPVTLGGGRYRVKRFLGEGGKKRVYLAHDARLERDVAVALIKTEGLDAAGIARVHREARAMGRLGDHPHVVTVHDIGDENDQPYIVSQYMAGGSVDELLQRTEGHRLPLDQTLQLASQICQALEHAHRQGIVHRDLKPANVWLTQDGVAKLGDFGLAVVLDRSRLTMPGMMVGTVAYIPPEQALGRPPEARGDLYSFGAMLYEMTTGRPPFLGDEAVGVISQHINTAPVAPSWHNKGVPSALEALILRLLAKAPEQRPESAAAVREMLAAISSTSAAEPREAAGGEPHLERLPGSVFVGRSDEMAQLRTALDDTLSNRGRLVMVVGDAGIGKTRIAEEFSTYARLRSAQVLVGRCYEDEGAPAYWPWVQVIRSYAHDREPAALFSELGSGAAEIAQVVSAVRERIPNIPVPPTLEPEQARFRLFDSVATFLKRAANGQPLVIVLDDLQWADKSSLMLLQFLAREMRSARLLVVGTYREAEVPRTHPLAEAVATLRREPHYGRILLRGLSNEDVRALLAGLGEREIPEGFLQLVHRETGGNPFFIEEILRHLVEEGVLIRDGGRWTSRVRPEQMSIPEGVREVVSRRLARLSDRCKRILSVAAAIGGQFELTVLERVSSLGRDEILEVVEEAVATGVVAEQPSTVGRWVFPHALVRQTLYEEMSTSRRVRLHREIGEALESLHASHLDAHLAALAHHFFVAAPGGDADKAVRYAIRAGDRAAAQMAHEEAVRHYENALQLAGSGERRDELERCELLMKLGEARWRAGHFTQAKEAFLQAARIARTLGAPEQLARAALGYGGRLPAFEAGIVDEVLVGLLEEGLGSLGEKDSALRAHVMARLAQALTFSRALRRLFLSREAVDMARRLGDKAVLAHVLRSVHVAFWGPDNVRERLELATELVQIAEQIGDRAAVGEGRIWRLCDFLELGDIAAVDRELSIALPLADELRQPYYQWLAVLSRSMRVLLDGRFEEADALAQQALSIGLHAQNQNAVLLFGAQMAMIRREQGRFGELEPTLTGLIAQYPLLPAWRCALPILYAETGRQADARREFENLAVHDFTDLPRDPMWLLAVGLLAEVCCELRDKQRAHRLYALLLPYAGLNAVVIGSLCFGSVDRSLGFLAVTMGEGDKAAQHFAAALEMNTRMGARPWLAHTQHQFAAMLLERAEPGDHDRALALLAQALDTAQALGMKGLVERAMAEKLRAHGIESTDIRTSIGTVASVVASERPDLRRHAAPDGTVTILFTDIEDSTAMTERLGDQHWLALLRIHNTIVREQVATHQGFEVKSQGDGFMVAFQSASRGLQCALALQRAVSAQNRRRPDQALRVRMGLHVGEALRDTNDFYGNAVNLAARIAGQARGGEIVVSGLLKELAGSTGDFRFGAVREVELKGLSGHHKLYNVEWSRENG